MQWNVVTSKDCKATVQGFLDAVEVWLRKPHVVNKRLCAADILSENTEHVDLSDREDVKRLETKYKLVDGILGVLQEAYKSSMKGGITGEAGAQVVHVTTRALLPKQSDRWPVLEEAVIVGKCYFDVAILDDTCTPDTCTPYNTVGHVSACV